MKLLKLTLEEILENKIREYNSKAWTERVMSIQTRMKDVQFYIRPKGDGGFEYDQFYAVYTIPEGIRILNEVSYSSCLSNNGFCRITIDPAGEVRKFLLKDRSGKEGYAENCRENRRILAENSRKFGAIFTTSL